MKLVQIFLFLCFLFKESLAGSVSKLKVFDYSTRINQDIAYKAAIDAKRLNKLDVQQSKSLLSDANIKLDAATATGKAENIEPAKKLVESRKLALDTFENEASALQKKAPGKPETYLQAHGSKIAVAVGATTLFSVWLYHHEKKSKAKKEAADQAQINESLVKSGYNPIQSRKRRL